MKNRNLPSIPSEFLDKMQRLLEDDYPAFVRCFSQPAVSGLRANTLKCSPEELKRIIKQDRTGLLALEPEPIPWCPSGFRWIIEPSTIPSEVHPGKHPLHSAGVYYIQDPSAMAVAEILAPQPGEWVLDLAAAPGGKTTHLAALMQNQGVLIANEVHPRRVWELAENIERCGVVNAAITNETPSRLANHFGSIFDKVLLDAPCSGEGMFRKSADAILAWSPALVRSCAARQLSLLKSAAELVRPGGLLAYSTCTFSPEENEQVIVQFLQDQERVGAAFELVQIRHNPYFRPGESRWLSPSTASSIPVERTVRLWSHHGGAEGHFIALLQRTDTARQKKALPHKKHLPSSAKKYFLEFCSQNLRGSIPASRLTLHGSYLYHIPEGLPSLNGLRVIHPGWWLGSIRGNRFQPSHALALGLKVDQVIRKEVLEIGDPTLQAYLRGESLSNPGEDGWVLIAIGISEIERAFPIGWGRRNQNILKNYYPHGLRRV